MKVTGVSFRASMSLLMLMGALSSCRSRNFGTQSDSLATLLSSSSSCGDALSPTRTNPTHCTGPVVFAPPFNISDQSLKSQYLLIDRKLLGAFIITDPAGNPIPSRRTLGVKYNRDLHYHLGGGFVGMRIIPVVDRNGIGSLPLSDSRRKIYEDYQRAQGKTANGFVVQGARLLDEALKKEFGFNGQEESSAYFGLLSYTHPNVYNGVNLSKIKFSDMGNPAYIKAENSITHLGAYVGEGRTRNSPYAYHHKRFWFGKTERDSDEEPYDYPAHVSIVTLPDVPPAITNQNINITLAFLNELNGGPQFPENYKQAKYQYINLEETLAFYRAWLDPKWVRPGFGNGPYLQLLRNNVAYATYCAAHVTVAMNVGLNVPQNEAGYVRIWGEKDGKDLWQKAQAAYQSLFQKPIPSLPSFRTLWERDGLTHPVQARAVGQSLVWAPLSTADVISIIVQQYFTFPDVGPVLASAGLLGFSEQVKLRMGLRPETFIAHSMPVIKETFGHDAAATLAIQNKVSQQGLTDYLNAKISEIKALAPQQAALLVPQIQSHFQLQGAAILALADRLQKAVPNSNEVIWLRAWFEYRKALQVPLAQARAVEIADPKEASYVQFYSPPMVVHAITSGLYAAHRDLRVRTVATIVPAEQAVFAGGNTPLQLDLYAPQKP